MQHRNSIIDEWNIPYDEVRIVERVGRGPLGEVSRGYWHGQVAVKTFCLDETTSQRHLQKFKEEVCTWNVYQCSKLSLCNMYLCRS